VRGGVAETAETYATTDAISATTIAVVIRRPQLSAIHSSGASPRK
jgi:hypothetical protein